MRTVGQAQAGRRHRRRAGARGRLLSASVNNRLTIGEGQRWRVVAVCARGAPHAAMRTVRQARAGRRDRRRAGARGRRLLASVAGCRYRVLVGERCCRSGASARPLGGRGVRARPTCGACDCESGGVRPGVPHAGPRRTLGYSPARLKRNRMQGGYPPRALLCETLRFQGEPPRLSSL